MPILATLFLVLTLGASALQAAPHSISGAAKVVDGDTLVVAGTTIRLLHIDAPESAQSCAGQPCGTDATRHLATLISGQPVRCTGAAVDAYGRLLAVCDVAGQDLNRKMVLDGHAMVFRRFGDTYSAEEADARSARRGLWRNDDPTPPWEFRAKRWDTSVQNAPISGCPIKGNINAEGARIYHTPYSRWYDRTRISTARGERWFCSEADALAAGWRAAYGS